MLIVSRTLKNKIKLLVNTGAEPNIIVINTIKYYVLIDTDKKT